ncbi:MAG: hypothetical protein V3R80_04065 [Candidatus Tectomicrobia bacterium]
MNYSLNLDLTSFDQLDAFALSASQDDKLGNKDDWFGCFRGALYGLYNRAAAVEFHYYKMHAWEGLGGVHATEYHLTSILFHMDSTLECMIFMLNALGFAAGPHDFLNVADEKEIRHVDPRNVDETDKWRGKILADSYKNYFPGFADHWLAHKKSVWEVIRDNHDISKHRSQIGSSGKVRSDAPDGFWTKHGVPPGLEVVFSPAEITHLSPALDVKLPRKSRKETRPEERISLEALTPQFCEFLRTSGVCILNDAKHMPLQVQIYTTSEASRGQRTFDSVRASFELMKQN